MSLNTRILNFSSWKEKLILNSSLILNSKCRKSQMLLLLNNCSCIIVFRSIDRFREIAGFCYIPRCMNCLLEMLQINISSGFWENISHTVVALEITSAPSEYKTSTAVVVSAPLLTGLVVRCWVSILNGYFIVP